MSSTFTPGPWRVRDNQIESMAVPPDEYGNQPLVLSLYGAMGGNDTEADARLIAASPSLYTAMQGLFEHCEMVHRYWGDGDNSKEAAIAIADARAALALVEG